MLDSRCISGGSGFSHTGVALVEKANRDRSRDRSPGSKGSDVQCCQVHIWSALLKANITVSVQLETSHGEGIT